MRRHSSLKRFFRRAAEEALGFALALAPLVRLEESVSLVRVLWCDMGEVPRRCCRARPVLICARPSASIDVELCNGCVRMWCKTAVDYDIPRQAPFTWLLYLPPAVNAFIQKLREIGKGPFARKAPETHQTSVALAAIP